jgi:TPR repeat protein
MCGKSAPLVLFLCLSLVSPACAGLYEGAAAYSKGEYARAYSELKPLAEQGSSEAQWYLGVMYHDGQGVPQDYAQAVKWFRKAVEQGYARAQYNLGVMYRRGHGVQQDNVEAVKWYRKAAEQGFAEAQYSLGVMVAEGQGVQQDFVQSHMWFDLAAASGDSSAVKSREIIAVKMTPSQIAEAQRLAKEWKPKGRD